MNTYPILYNRNEVTFGKLNSSQEILSLFDKIFGRKFKIDILEWFASCPTGGNVWYGAFYRDVPVAMYGLLPMKLNVNNQVYDGALCNNVGVTPEFQGKGLFQSLGEYALKDSNFPIVVGIPNSKAVKGHKRIGWKSYGVLELLSGEVSERRIKFVELDDFIFCPSNDDYQFSIVKNLDWLKWRYSKPTIDYKQSLFVNHQYVIWKNYQQKKQVLETNNFKLAIELGGTVDLWVFKDSSQSNYLKNHGFSSILENEFILYQNENFELSFDADRCQFQLGDNDVF